MNNPYGKWTDRAFYAVALVTVVCVPFAALYLWELVTR